MRADRLLSILLLLQTHHRMKARDLARRLEVSERTIHRDMEALGVAGVPVLAERGSGGGWSLLEDYRTNLTGLNESEIQVLFLSNSTRLLTDLGWQKASDAALIKLLAALPSIRRRDAEYVRQRIHVDVASWHSTEEPVPHLAVLQEAIWQERRLHLFYQRGEKSIERVVDPLGLVAKGTIWYLVAAVEGQIRNYRVSRIQDVIISEQPCVRPPDFDLAQHWSRSSVEFKASLPRYVAKIRISQQGLATIEHRGRYSQFEQISQPDANGWVTAHIIFNIREEACGYLLSLGAEAEILEPLDLREQVVKLAESILSLYKSEAHQLSTL